jgi:formamidopyrimidine-DNA glycosylase
MPELPDIVVYLEALEQRILGKILKSVTITSPFLLRTAVPPVSSVADHRVIALRRLGKRICIGLEEDLWLVLHLMIAGRLHWRGAPEQAAAAGGRSTGSVRTGSRSNRVSARVPGRPPKNRLAIFDFTSGALSLTEAGTQRRASLHLVSGDAALQRFNPGGLEVFEIDLDAFAKVLQSENHTLKRALTDPRLLSGIGNAYSDEILWEAQLSPVALTQKLKSDEIERLFNSTRTTLTKWIELLRGSSPTVREGAAKVRTGSRSDRVVREEQEAGAGGRSTTTIAFPEHVTAFRPEMAVHGKYQQPCPRCGARVQRIRYASNETNYCPVCQTAGKLLADRALSRLLRSDWPRTADELEALPRRH